MPPTVPLNEVAVAVQNAVQQILGKHGVGPIEKLWVGFVANETLANPQEVAGKLATSLGREGGVQATASIGELEQTAGAAAATTTPIPPRIKIIGLVFKPPAVVQK
jgi:hypothetical protein